MKEIPINLSEQKTIPELFQHELFLFYVTGKVVENWRDSEQLYHDVRLCARSLISRWLGRLGPRNIGLSGDQGGYRATRGLFKAR